MEDRQQLLLVYRPLNELLKSRWAQNAKRHDIEQVARAIQRYGFRDPVAIDENIGIAEGNGRTEALGLMKERGLEAPRGIVVEDGEWLVPTLIGMDAVSEAEAKAYAVDHNNLTLGGGSFLAQDVLRLWDEGLYQIFTEPESLPVSFEDEALKALILAHNEDPLAQDDQTATTAANNSGGAGSDSQTDEPPASHIRMVQLFLTNETLPEFQSNAEKLGRAYEKSSVTDTVIECLKRAVAGL